MRLIDADALKDRFWDGSICKDCPKKKPRCYNYCDAPGLLTDDIERLIDGTPTVDAEPVVRCKDCKYYSSNPMAGGVGECEWSTDALDDNGYCYRGERRE